MFQKVTCIELYSWCIKTIDKNQPKLQSQTHQSNEDLAHSYVHFLNFISPLKFLDWYLLYRPLMKIELCYKILLKKLIISIVKQLCSSINKCISINPTEIKGYNYPLSAGAKVRKAHSSICSVQLNMLRICFSQYSALSNTLFTLNITPIQLLTVVCIQYMMNTSQTLGKRHLWILQNLHRKPEYNFPGEYAILL